MSKPHTRHTMKYQKPLSPEELVVKKPQRRSSGEGLLRRLMASSYPHAIFANTAYKLVDGIDKEQFELSQEQILSELAKVEGEFSFLDFPRYIELKRHDEGIVVTFRRLILDDSASTIKDQRHHHEDLAEYHLNVDDSVVIGRVEDIVIEWANAHYQVAVPFQLRTKNINDSEWVLQSKVMKAERNTRDLRDVKFAKEAHNGVFSNVVNAMKASMEKPRFHVAMTPKAIFCFDQGLKITTARIK